MNNHNPSDGAPPDKPESSERPFNPHSLLPRDDPHHPEYQTPQEGEKKEEEPVVNTNEIHTVEKKSKIPLILFLALISLAVVSGIGWYIGSANKSQQLNTQSPSSRTQVTPTVIVDPMADWKTYVSSESGFMLKHPEQVKVSVHRDGAQPVITVFTLVGPTQKENTEFYDGISLQLSSGELGDKTLPEFVNAKAQEIKEHAQITKDVEPVTVSGINGFRYQAEGLGKITYMYLPDGGAYLQVADATVDPTNQGYAKIVSDMLATLTYTHEAPENSTDLDI